MSIIMAWVRSKLCKIDKWIFVNCYFVRSEFFAHEWLDYAAKYVHHRGLGTQQIVYD